MARFPISEAMLTGQDRTVDWEYRTCRFGRQLHSNKAGDGPPSKYRRAPGELGPA